MSKRITKRRVTSFSICATAFLKTLDFANWFQDSPTFLNRDGNSYIHVKSKDDDTWHRVHPRKMKGKKVQRLAVYEGSLYWLYDDV